MMNCISATAVSKIFSRTEYSISSVDGNTHKITLFTNKLWDLCLLKLTEIVHYDERRKKYNWDATDEWGILMSIRTIAECLGLSDSVDSLTHLYDRIVAAVNVLRNISVTITAEGTQTKIDGYLGFVGVRDASGIDDIVTKSNALFGFCVNHELIEYIKSQTLGLYNFNHNWLFTPEHCQNAYAAAKRLGRHFCQNSYKRKSPKDSRTIGGISMDIGTLRNCLPCLNNKDEGANREALDKAMQSIPDAKYAYLVGKQRLTFDELKKLRLRKNAYNKTGISIEYADHPNISNNGTSRDFIRLMNEDSLFIHSPFYSIEDAEKVINHAGTLKTPVKSGT